MGSPGPSHSSCSPLTGLWGRPAGTPRTFPRVPGPQPPESEFLTPNQGVWSAMNTEAVPRDRGSCSSTPDSHSMPALLGELGTNDGSQCGPALRGSETADGGGKYSSSHQVPWDLQGPDEAPNPEGGSRGTVQPRRWPEHSCLTHTFASSLTAGICLTHLSFSQQLARSPTWSKP